MGNQVREKKGRSVVVVDAGYGDKRQRYRGERKMREIKFRTWAPKVRKYFYWGVGDISGNGSFFTGPPSVKEATHEQFTGLLDPNREYADVYEGDIYRHCGLTMPVTVEN